MSVVFLMPILAVCFSSPAIGLPVDGSIVSIDTKPAIFQVESQSSSKKTDSKHTGNLKVAQGPSRVPAAPNRSIVTGRVLSYCIISSKLLKVKPDMTLYGLKLLIENSEDVEGKINFTKNRIGEVIQIYTKEKLAAELFNKTIKARVDYTGDERGGKYWIKDIDILE